MEILRCIPLVKVDFVCVSTDKINHVNDYDNDDHLNYSQITFQTTNISKRVQIYQLRHLLNSRTSTEACACFFHRLSTWRGGCGRLITIPPTHTTSTHSTHSTHQLESCRRDTTAEICGKTAVTKKFLWNYHSNNRDGDSSYRNTAVTGTFQAGIPQWFTQF